MEEVQENASESDCKRRKSTEENYKQIIVVPMDIKLNDDSRSQSQSFKLQETASVLDCTDLPAALNEIHGGPDFATFEQRVKEEESEQGTVGDVVDAAQSPRSLETTQIRQRLRNYFRNLNADADTSPSSTSSSHESDKSPWHGTGPLIGDIVLDDSQSKAAIAITKTGPEDLTRKSTEENENRKIDLKQPLSLPMDINDSSPSQSSNLSGTHVKVVSHLKETATDLYNEPANETNLVAGLNEVNNSFDQRVEVQEDERGAVGGVVDEAQSTRTLETRQMRQRLRNYRRRSNADPDTSSTPGSTSSNERDESPLSGNVPLVGDTIEDESRSEAAIPAEEVRRTPHLSPNNMFEIGDSDNSNSDQQEDDDGVVDDDEDDDDDDDEFDDDHDFMNDEVNAADAAEETNTLQELLGKPKPNYTWNHQLELMRREHGLSRDAHTSLRGGGGFASRFYSSRHVVERMKLSHCLRKHSGCVNCLNFNRQGDLLCTGSDDTRIIVWDWAKSKARHCFKSGHNANIFQTKFIDESVGCLDIVSTSRDGQVRRSIVPPSGGSKIQSSCLYKHRGAVHKLVVSPQCRSEIITVGEDGYIRCKDLRTDGDASELSKVVAGSKKNRKVRLFSIAHHPFASQIVVCGCDNFVRVYDKRNMAKVVHEMCPEHLVDTSIPQVTCCVYNSTGSEVLGSYSDDHIYLFDNNTYKTGEYLHRYRGHYNHKTIKGVNFFGPNSEYIISGSDCGNIFFWDKNTESILNFMPGDTMGVVNCLEPHPTIPVLATSGLDHNIKIWTPNSEIYPPDLSKLELCVKRNLKRSVIDESAIFDDRQFHYFIRQFLRRPPRSRESSLSRNENVGGSSSGGADGSNDDDSNSNPPMGNLWSSSNSSSSEDNEYPEMEGIHCRTQ